MKIARIVALALALALHGTGACAQEIIVIAHPGLKLTADDVHAVYSGEKQLDGSVKLNPIDNASNQEQFLARFLNLALTKYKSAWAKKAFREGLSPPPVKGGDAEVADYVKRTPGGIGYIKGPAPAGVSVVAQKG